MKRKHGKAEDQAVDSESAGQPQIAKKEDSGMEEQNWSKSKKKRMRRLKGIQHRGGTPDKKGTRPAIVSSHSAANENNTANESKDHVAGAKIVKKANEDVVNPENKSKLDMASGRSHQSVLQKSFLARLSGSRFRELNEELYTTTSDSAFARFQSNPALFEQYHEGFRKQVTQWPVNPVDIILRSLITLNRKRTSKGGSDQIVVADFGCGDAKLAKELIAIEKDGGKKAPKKEKNNDKAKGSFLVHSFDLVSGGNPLVTPCDMTDVPLPDDAVDVGVFCLALMGTNIPDFIREAHRVLRKDGILKIAEVRSRFEAATDVVDESENTEQNRKKGLKKKRVSQSKKAKDEKLLEEFLGVMEQLGFECMKKDQSNTMFVMMDFKKNGKTPSTVATFSAKPCIYKRR